MPKEIVYNSYLNEAIDSINNHGVYWNSSISRANAYVLSELLSEKGYNVFPFEVQPDYEHIFILEEVYTREGEKIKQIAQERSKINNEGKSDVLPIW